MDSSVEYDNVLLPTTYSRIKFASAANGHRYANRITRRIGVYAFGATRIMLSAYIT